MQPHPCSHPPTYAPTRAAPPTQPAAHLVPVAGRGDVKGAELGGHAVEDEEQPEALAAVLFGGGWVGGVGGGGWGGGGGGGGGGRRMRFGRDGQQLTLRADGSCRGSWRRFLPAAGGEVSRRRGATTGGDEPTAAPLCPASGTMARGSNAPNQTAARHSAAQRSTPTWYMPWLKMKRHMWWEMRGSSRPWGLASSRSGVGASVARAAQSDTGESGREVSAAVARRWRCPLQPQTRPPLCLSANSVNSPATNSTAS